MRNLYCCLLLFFLAMALPKFTFAQKTTEFWRPIANHELQPKQTNIDRLLPVRFKSFQLTNPDSFKTVLSNAPLRFSNESKNKTVIISIPMPNGRYEDFKVFESPVMAPLLAEKFPSIKTYSATGITNPNSVAKIDYTPRGFHAMIFTIGQNPVFVDPFDSNNQTYIAYYKKDFRSKEEHFECAVSESSKRIYTPNQITTRSAGDCQLREYRLALACTGEYAQYHDDGDNSNGDIIADVIAAMNITMNRVNGVFEKDAGITMVLVDNNEDIIYTDGGSDPYSNNNGGAMLSQNQTTCDNEIGSANYDIGHVFSTGGGGVAYLNAPCNNSIKAGGVTGGGSPEGDPFDIDYVAHEMGHQFGGRHTQNNSCNRDNSSSYEPGSASTIMGYAGICSPNVQSNSDDYYHAISIQQFGNFTTGAGNSCANIINSNNNQPTADAGADYTIPISTPFVLTGIGTDADGDPMTYCWEQWDREVAAMPPVSTSTSGPAFRTFAPSTNSERYFPRLSVVAGSGIDTWEVLPSVSRDLNFRLTVRDNNSAYGCTDEDDMTVTSSASSGPFLVTYPNTAMEWDANTTETITWDVANTTSAPVSCANVDILYSTDGGLSFPNILVANVPNDGSHPITVPEISTSQFRIIVKCSDNIFFDMSDENITIGVEIVCVQFTSVDVPVSISSSGTPIVTSNLVVALGETTTDINVLNLEGTHTYLGDLRFKLTDPLGNQLTLVDRECGNNDDFDVNFDDAGGSLSCPYNDNQTASAVDNLSNFNGLNPDGTWVLEIADLANQDGGQLDAWSIEICYEEASGPLPLNLLGFDAIAQKEDILLTWNTANEINNRGFEIQRSTHPQNGFERIGWVDGLGNATRGNYFFTDQNVIPGILYYYRLKQIDFDEQFSYSKIVQARLTIEALQVGISPNPANNNLNVILSKDDYNKGVIQIIDMLGRIMQTITFEMSDKKEIELKIENLSRGVYFLSINLDNEEHNIQKFIKR
jgi:subtilisin-like proprotein convertase family protein